MLKLFKYAKSQIISVIAIILLVILDMFIILQLPEYTAKIVNIGIQQSGISQVIPTAIRQETFEKLMNFMSDNDKQIIKKYYTLTSIENMSQDHKDSFIKKYPIIENEPVYISVASSQANITKELSTIFTKAIMTQHIINNDSSKIFNDVTKQLLSKNNNSSFEEIFMSLPSNTKKQIQSVINEHLKQLSDTQQYQISISTIKQEYEAIGIDLNAMQMDCILGACARILFLSITSLLINVIIIFISAKTSAKLSQNLRALIYNKVLAFSGKEMDRFSNSTLLNRTTSDVQQIQLFMPIFLRFFFSLPVATILIFFKTIQTGANLLGVIVFSIGAILALNFAAIFIVSPKYKLIQKTLDKLNIISRETLNGVLTIRAFCRQKHQTNKFKETNKNFFNLSLFVNRITSCLMPAMIFIMNISGVVILLFSSNQIIEGSIQVGTVMTVLQYAMQLIVFFIVLSMLLYAYPRVIVCSNRINEILNTCVDVRDSKLPVEFDENKKYQIQFENVSFKYDGNKNNTLNNINFTAKPGEITAIVGSTGSGKSTLVKLISRFYDVSEGRILVSGASIKHIKLKHLRKNIGYIPQNSSLFLDTIKHNVTLGKKISNKQVKNALKVAQCDDFVFDSGKDLNFKISQNAQNISGGQKQRLTIARAIAKNPNIYIFDDSFSSLDYKTQNNLMSELTKIASNATLIIVTQDITTVSNADKIIVLDKGNIVGEGSHNNLIKSCDVYRDLANSQISREVSKSE